MRRVISSQDHFCYLLVSLMDVPSNFSLEYWSICHLLFSVDCGVLPDKGSICLSNFTIFVYELQGIYILSLTYAPSLLKKLSMSSKFSAGSVD